MTMDRARLAAMFRRLAMQEAERRTPRDATAALPHAPLAPKPMSRGNVNLANPGTPNEIMGSFLSPHRRPIRAGR